MNKLSAQPFDFEAPVQAAEAPSMSAHPQAQPEPEPQPRAEPVPREFVTDTEHPVLPIPFNARIGEHWLEGAGLSITGFKLETGRPISSRLIGTHHIAQLVFDFEGFALTLAPEVVVIGCEDGEIMLDFADPTGTHLPQLRHIINSYIAGDYISLDGLTSYTGPVKPKAKAAEEAPEGRFSRRNIQRVGSLILSVCLMAGASYALYTRFTTDTELRPVFITRDGTSMRATGAGQIGYLDPSAGAGEVLYTISANSGDVLSFLSPCDCQVQIASGIEEGTTVLPSDPIATLYDDPDAVRVSTQISSEGLARAMSGERVFLDMADGRHIPVEVRVDSATTAAAQAGDLFLPVRLVPEAGMLGAADIGMSARVRLVRSFLPSFGAGRANAATGEDR